MPSRRATQSELWPLFPATPRGELYNRKAVLTGNARLPKGERSRPWFAPQERTGGFTSQLGAQSPP